MRGLGGWCVRIRFSHLGRLAVRLIKRKCNTVNEMRNGKAGRMPSEPEFMEHGPCRNLQLGVI